MSGGGGRLGSRGRRIAQRGRLGVKSPTEAAASRPVTAIASVASVQLILWLTLCPVIVTPSAGCPSHVVWFAVRIYSYTLEFIRSLFNCLAATQFVIRNRSDWVVKDVVCGGDLMPWLLALLAPVTTCPGHSDRLVTQRQRPF